MIIDFVATSEKAVDIMEPIPYNKRTILSSKAQKGSVGISLLSTEHFIASLVIRAKENEV